MKNSKLSQKTGLISLCFLALSSHFPITDTPTGSDNFYYISAVKSILTHGEIFWAENLLSFYGLFPGTTPLGGLILATAVTEITGLSVHHYHLIHSVSLSILSIFGFFLLSGEFTSNYKSRWFSSLAFSIAPRFLTLAMWRFSLRFLLISLLPLFIWALLRTVNKRYGRNPKKLLILLGIFTLILPSIHRMALLLPGIFLVYLISLLCWFWQETAVNRERAGRQVMVLILFFAFYLFYLQYLDFSPYSPDSELIGVYYLNEGTIISSIVNLAFYYLICVGPLVFLSLIGLVFWVQEGRISFSYIFSLVFLALSLFIISDILYISYLFTFGLLLFIAPGLDFFIDNLQDYKGRFGAFFISLIVLSISFSSLDLSYRVDAHDREELYYSYNVRQSSLSASFWINKVFDSEIIESNDLKRHRPIAAYSNSINIHDSSELSSNLIRISEMELERITISDLYLSSSDHLWNWTNASNITGSFSGSINLSIVNLAMANFSGQSSSAHLMLDYKYKFMPDYNYKLYISEELAIYWTPDY